MKFCDESHFKSKGMLSSYCTTIKYPIISDLSCNLALSPVGEECDVPSSDMNDKVFTVSLLTSLDLEDVLPFSIDLRVDSNTQWDFLRYVVTRFSFVVVFRTF